VGIDATSGAQRFNFGILELNEGIGLVPLVMGLFGISEVLLNVEQSLKREIFQTKIKGLFPTREDWKKSAAPIARGSVLGFFLGVLPGGGALISSFVAYAIEKKISKHPEEFGKGAIEGVAGPETANNSATGGAFVPLLTLGIPSNVAMAMLMGALLIHGLQPGPMMMKQHPNLFWGVVTSMYVGNVMLLILNLPLIGMWVQVLKVPYRILFPLIILFCLIGAYSVSYSVTDLLPMLEISLRQSLTISNGDFFIFFTRPISAVVICIALFLVLSPFFPRFRRKRIAIQE
jgi:putative tricarboxylic transport membrane protein